ncbi:MAG: S1/P1 Nuclease [Phenylobacterium sp.]|uniref:S1/P1 Nuclease n=1 Tax=Phenylobacterium sp. TaxID=1871053 RepID=UPI00391A46AF
MHRLIRPAAAALCVLALVPGHALAWGAMGHRIIGQAAMEALPAETPAFLRTPTAASDVGELSRELDRSKGAGEVHDQNRDPGHFVDVEDDGRILGGPTLGALPPTRADYETALRAAGTDSWKAGYLPYSIIESWQQLAKDFGYWRALNAAEARSADPGRRAWYAEDRRRREAQILRTIGDLSHLVGDGAQPLHVTAHYNGWGDYPNPKGYTQAKIHGPFEGDLVFAQVKPDAVRAAMAPPALDARPIEVRTAAYLAGTAALVESLYQLEKSGGLAPNDPRGGAFATARLAAGASELRDAITEAWRASAAAKVGWPAVSVADVEAGRVDPFDALYGVD